MSPKGSPEASKAPEALTASVEANVEDWRARDKVRGFSVAVGDLLGGDVDPAAFHQALT